MGCHMLGKYLGQVSQQEAVVVSTRCGRGELERTYDCTRAHSQSRTLYLLRSFQWCRSTTVDTQLACSFFCLMRSQASLDVVLVLELDLLDGWGLGIAWRRIASNSATVCLLLPEICSNALIMLLADLLGYTFHTKDLDIKSLSVGKRIFDRIEGLLVDLLEMDRKT
jgi:hypothetical protein